METNPSHRTGDLCFDKTSLTQQLLSKQHSTLMESLQIYKRYHQFLGKEVTQSDEEIAEYLLDLSCKAEYLQVILAATGQVEIEGLYNEIYEQCEKKDPENAEYPFESVKDLENFILSMRPIFIYIPGRVLPRNTSNGFRKFCQFAMKTLLDVGELNNDDVIQIIESSRTQNETDKNKKNVENFKTDEIYLDFYGLRKFAAMNKEFVYDKTKNTLKLNQEDVANFSVAFLYPILIPSLYLDIKIRDNSRQLIANAILIKSLSYFEKGEIFGLGPLTGYGSYYLDTIKPGEKKEQRPVRTYVTVSGPITVNDACQLTALKTADSKIGAKNGPFVDSDYLMEPCTRKEVVDKESYLSTDEEESELDMTRETDNYCKEVVRNAIEQLDNVEKENSTIPRIFRKIEEMGFPEFETMEMLSKFIAKRSSYFIKLVKNDELVYKNATKGMIEGLKVAEEIFYEYPDGLPMERFLEIQRSSEEYECPIIPWLVEKKQLKEFLSKLDDIVVVTDSETNETIYRIKGFGN